MNVSVARNLAAVSAPRLLDITADNADAEWDRFVLNRRDASNYHLSGWRRVFENAFGHETLCLAAREHGRIVGVLPLVIFRSRLFGRFAVSLPFVNYGGVLARDHASAVFLLEQARALAAERRLAHVELRHTARQFPDLEARTHKVGMLLRLERDTAKAWESLDRKVRNHVRKAQKSQLTSRVGGPELLDRFYSVFARNMRDLGTPVYGKAFFLEILKSFPDSSRIAVVYLKDQPVAAGFLYAFRGVLEIPWASSDRRYNRLAPNMLLYSSALKYGCEEGFSLFDFGRSTPGGGTYKFKEQWGARPVPLHWHYWMSNGGPLPDLSPSNAKFKLAIAVWQRLPLFVSKLLGPSIVRFIP